MYRLKQTIVGTVAVAVLFSGCSGIRQQAFTPSRSSAAEERPETLTPPIARRNWRGTQFEDVPVPADFVLDYDVSYVNVLGDSNRARVADLHYRGDTALTDALTSVQEGMLRSGWQLRSLTGVAIKSLRFVKGEEECEVIVREGDEGESVIAVRLHPRP